jgi:hypothetical protein
VPAVIPARADFNAVAELLVGAAPPADTADSENTEVKEA